MKKTYGEFKADTHFIQKESFGCGVYAVANALANESFITSQRLEASSNGNNLGQLNKWLVEDNHNLFIEPLYFNCTGKRLPKKVCGLQPFGERVSSIPVLLDIQFSEEGKMHFVAGHITVEGDLMVIDSLKSTIEITTLSRFNNKYFRVFGLYHFREIDTGNNLMWFE